MVTTILGLALVDRLTRYRCSSGWRKFCSGTQTTIEDMFKGLSPGWQTLPGGLCHTNLSSGCTVFAAVSGSSAATLSTVGKMFDPELRARNYS